MIFYRSLLLTTVILPLHMLRHTKSYRIGLLKFRSTNSIGIQTRSNTFLLFNRSYCCYSPNKELNGYKRKRLNMFHSPISNSFVSMTKSHISSSDSSSVDSYNSFTSKELIITCSDGMNLAAKLWRSEQTKADESNIPEHSEHLMADSASHSVKIVCLHGWLDNAASFNLLAPMLHSKLMQNQSTRSNENNHHNIEILALDFPGHGHSAHKSQDGPTQLFSEYALYVHDVLCTLGWINTGSTEATLKTKSMSNPITLIGHSMGAGVALIYSAAFPENVHQLILLEGAGPIARNGSDISKHIRQGITRRISSNKTLFPQYKKQEIQTDMNRSTKITIHEPLIKTDNDEEPTSTTNNDVKNGGRVKKRIYSNIQSATETRMQTAKLSPGNQYISREAAEAMVCRATIPSNIAPTFTYDKAGGFTDNSNQSESYMKSYTGTVIFRHDPRLQLPSLQYFTKEQVDSLYRDIQCPTCLIGAKDGWPETFWNVESILSLLRPTFYKKLDGSHHFHADPDTVENVAVDIAQFMSAEYSERKI